MIQISRFFGQTEKLGIDWEWEILFVLSGSMDGVEKIFKVVECHSVECEAFLLRRAGVGGKGDEGKKYEKQSFHSVAKEGYVWNGDTDAT